MLTQTDSDHSHRYLKYIGTALISFVAVLCCRFSVAGQDIELHKNYAPGMEYLIFRLAPAIAGETGQKLHILRIDPARVRLKLLTASELDGKLRTPAEWCRDFNLKAAINAGMFLKDYSTNVGYLRNGTYMQNGRWNKQYRSALGFDPKKNGLPPAALIDLDEPDSKKKLDGYGTVVQNLRLLKADGINVWERSEKKWSEAALAMDQDGRVLFIFCRTPLPMWRFNQAIAALGIGVVRAMHLEGGPLAGLSIRAGDLSLDLAGIYETGLESSSNTQSGQMPIPNVIGVVSK